MHVLRYCLQLVVPLGYIEGVLQEEQFESVQQQLFCQDAQVALDGQAQKGVALSVAKVTVGVAGYLVDDQSDAVIEMRFLIL